jgi:hypothetical protein
MCLFGGRFFFQQTVGIPMGTNCAPFLMQGLLKKNENKLARSCKFTYRYIVKGLSLKYCKLGDFVDRIYPIGLDIKDTTEMSASYLDRHLEADSEGSLRMKFSIYM